MLECSFMPMTNTSFTNTNLIYIPDIVSHKTHRSDKSRNELEWEKSHQECTFVPDLSMSQERPTSQSYHNVKAEYKSVLLMDKGIKLRTLTKST